VASGKIFERMAIRVCSFRRGAEQARGQNVDKRADIWAFGVVLYEMLTGQRLFGGETVSDTLAEVLKKEIDFTALPSQTPPHIHSLLRRCLQRDPRKRLRDIADAWQEPGESAPPAPPAPGALPWKMIAGAMTLAALPPMASGSPSAPGAS